MKINNVEVEGLREIQELFKELPVKLGGTALRSSLRNAAKKMFEEVRNRVPVKTGNLKRTIRITAPRSPDPENAVVYINTTNFVGRLLETGTRKMNARPFMGPAFDATADDFVERFKEEAYIAIEKAQKKQASGALGGLSLGEFAARRKRNIEKRRRLNKAKGEFVSKKFDEHRSKLGNRAFYRLSEDELKALRKQYLKEARETLGHYKPKKAQP